jgi:hypothetical protein
MAVPQDTSLNGLRNSIITSIFGRRAGLSFGNASDTGDYLVGPKDIRVQVEGVSSAGSTIVSTSVANLLSPWGVSLVGATGASATTAYQLGAPVPGTVKYIFNPTTGQANIGTTGAGAFICSSASVASTQGNIFLVGKGAYVELLALTTNLWGLAENLAITTVTTGNLVQIS